MTTESEIIMKIEKLIQHIEVHADRGNYRTDRDKRRQHLRYTIFLIVAGGSPVFDGNIH